MSLFRTALVVGVLIYCLPSDPAKQQAIIRSAGDALSWGLTYCQRDPDTCAKAKVAFGDLGQKAKFGATLVGNLVEQWTARRDPAPEPTDDGQSSDFSAPADRNNMQGPPQPMIPSRKHVARRMVAPDPVAPSDTLTASDISATDQ
jgi:hypothetical protein